MTGDRGDADRAAEIVASMGDGTVLRSVAAIIVGFVTLTLGSVVATRAVLGATGFEPGGESSRAFLAWSLGSRFLVAALAGFLTARAAPRRPGLHVLGLAGLITFLALAAIGGLRAAGDVELDGPAWYPIAMLFVGPTGVLAGGLATARRHAAAKREDAR